LPNGQYCGSLEFSAPKGNVYVPEWIMQNIGVREGEQVHIISVNDVPKGEWCKFQPHTKEMVDLMAELGPRFFLEDAMRHFSVLNKGERLVVEHAGKKHSVTVKDTKPQSVISILGNVDLHVEFAPPLDGSYGEEEVEGDKRAESKSKFESKAQESPFVEEKEEEAEEEKKWGPGNSLHKEENSSSLKKDVKKQNKKSIKEEESSFPVSSVGNKTVESEITSPYTGEGVPEVLADESWTTVPFPTSLWRSRSAFVGDAATEGNSAKNVAPLGVSKKIAGEGASTVVSSSDPNASTKRTSIFPSFFANEEKDNSLLNNDKKAKFFQGSGHSLKVGPSTSTTSSSSSASSPVEEGHVEAGSEGEVVYPEPVCTESSEDDQKDPCKEACSNCGRFVNSDRMSLHSLHCHRSLSRCNACSLVFHRTDMPLHMRSHESVRCVCGEMIENAVLEQHMASSCDFRAVSCRYCSESQRFINLEEHETLCGETVDLCLTCKQRVKLCDKEAHNAECKPQCFCGERVHIDLMDEHKQTTCSWRKIRCDFCQMQVRQLEFESHQTACGSRTVECEKCFKFIKRRDLAVHEVSCTGPAPASSAAAELTDPTAIMENRIADLDDQLVERIRGISEVTAGFSLREDAEETATSSPVPVKAHRSVVSPPTGPRTSGSNEGRHPDDFSLPAARAPSAGGYACPKCLFDCQDFEDLQMHMLTICPKRVDMSNPLVKAFDKETRAINKKKIVAADSSAPTAPEGEGKRLTPRLRKKSSFVDKLRRETSRSSLTVEASPVSTPEGRGETSSRPSVPSYMKPLRRATGKQEKRRSIESLVQGVAAGNPLNAVRAARRQSSTKAKTSVRGRRNSQRTTVPVPQRH